MNKICTNPKNYKLTQGKEYVVVSEEEEYVLIINDNNKTQRYAKELFEEQDITVEEEVIPLLPQRTEQDCINSIQATTNPQNNNIELRYNDIENNEHLISYMGTVSTSNNSCGIVEYDGLNNIMSFISENVNTGEEDMIELQKALFKIFVQRILSTRIGNSRWMTFSTNQLYDYEDFYTVLDEMSQIVTPWEQNPNSRSMIKLWILNRDLV